MDTHGGQISVSSDGEGKGCSFTIKIPMVRHFPRPSLTTTSTTPYTLTPIEENKPRLETTGTIEINPRTVEISVPQLVNNLLKSGNSSSLPSFRVFVAEDSNLNRKMFLKCLEAKNVLVVDEAKNILVVDDSNLNRKMVIKCLEAMGHICEYAVNGQQAVEKVEKRMGWNGHSKGSGSIGKPYDVILMDFVVSIFSGSTRICNNII
jgi:CheY-like chemotaxis protein